MKKKTPMVKPKASPKKKAPVKRKNSGSSNIPWKLIIGLLLILLSPFYYGYVLKGFTTTWQWLKDIGENPNYRTYKSFHIRIPSKYAIHGIDVSYAQGKIDWQKVKAMQEDSVHISFAFVKATEGLLTVDPYFQRNWREAPKAGITCGAYHFFHPEKNGLWQARFFLQNAKTEKGDLPPVADVEQLNNTSPAVMRKELKAFLSQVQSQTKIRPIIYTNLSFYVDYLAGYFDGYPLWIANYQQEDLKIDPNTKWQFWQHSDVARVNGIGHTVDFNAFRGDSLAFSKLLVR
ncbi:MAG: glycoside hydrolase family 25 protein [Bacteroidota bacterium]